MVYDYEWNDAKRAANLVKHGIDFVEMEGFDLLTAVIVEDRRRDYGEARFRAYLRVGGSGRALSFTWRGDRIRVISLRRAREKEMRRHGL
jgi:uncharacterized DUF497 family protein